MPDNIITTVEMERVSGSIIKVASKIQKELLPLGGNLSSDDLKSWWKRRAVPINQGNMKKILSAQGIASPQAYLLKNCGLSLSDHYWIKPLDSDLTWEKVNLFTNDFKDEIGELQFKEKGQKEITIDLTNKTIFYPSGSVQGELQKKWVLQDGKRYLIKGNYGESCQQSINEVIATLLHERQNKVPFTKYSLCNITVEEGEGIGCICEDFASEEVEFIPAYDVVCSQKQNNETSSYEHFIQICGDHGLDREEVRGFLEYQILTDFVLTNTDRHFNNFGVLRNTKTLEFIGMAPVFDTGNSLFWNIMELSEKDNLLNVKVNSFKYKELDLLKYVKDTSCVERNELPEEVEIQRMLEKAKLSERKVRGILRGYRRKLELLEKIQQGEKIWGYKYDG